MVQVVIYMYVRIVIFDCTHLDTSYHRLLQSKVLIQLTQADQSRLMIQLAETNQSRSRYRMVALLRLLLML